MRCKLTKILTGFDFAAIPGRYRERVRAERPVVGQPEKHSGSVQHGGVTIHADGRVEFAPGVAPNEAAKQFAEALQGYVGWRWKCGCGGINE